MSEDLTNNPFVQLVLGLRRHQAELDRAWWAGTRDCRRRNRRRLAEEAWAMWNSDDWLEEYPQLRGAGKGCPVRPMGDRSPCAFPACGALDTYGIPVDAETRARYKIQRMEHDPE